MTPRIVIPAAGASSRMRGRDKLLETVGGMSLLRRQTRRALATGCAVAVCLPPAGPRAAEIADLPAEVIAVPDADEGMGATLRTAARALGAGPALILLPDVPGVDTADIEAILAEFDARGADTVVRASDPAGRPGTPLALPARLLPRFARLTGDDGGRSVLSGEQVILVRFPDDRATRDLDTPEDWEAWRASPR